MVNGQTAIVLRHIRKLVGAPAEGEPTDGQLLERFAATKEEAAFAALVRRHGPMVLGVCRRVLRNPDDAEDAFQATFLVLVRRAAFLDRRRPLSNWLYTVAYHTALRAKSTAARRRAEERQALDMPRADSETAAAWRELQPVLDEELHRLPDKIREPFILCYLQGKTNAEAARELGWPAGTVKSRLSRARDLLRQRLIRRGVVLSGGGLALALAENAAAAVPGGLAEATIQSALLFGAGSAAAPGVVSAQAAALAEGVLNTMFVSKVKLAAFVVLTLGLVGLGVAAFSYHALAQKSGGADKSPQAAKDKKPSAKAPLAPKAAQKGKLTIPGKVLDTADKPIANAEVALLALGRRSGQRVLAQGKTDAKGAYRLEVKSAGPGQFYQMTVLARAKGFGLGWAPTMEIRQKVVTGGVKGYAWASSTGYTAKAKASVDVRLRPEQVIKGRLLDLQGQPAAKVTFRVASVLGDLPKATGDPLAMKLNRIGGRGRFELSQRRQAGFSFDHPAPKDLPLWPKPVTTDASGRFELRGFGRDQDVEVLVEDERFATQKQILDTGHQEKPKETVRALAAPQRFEGKVVYGDTGKPFPKAWVSVTGIRGFPAAGEEIGVHTDAQGRFKINPYPGDFFMVSVVPPQGEPYLPFSKRFNWAKGSVIQKLALTLPRGVQLRGKVVDNTTGKPVAGARVYFQQLQDNNPNRVLNLQPYSFYPGISRADGSYQVVAPASKGHLLCDRLGPEFITEVVGYQQLVSGKPGGQRQYFNAVLPLDIKPQKGPKDLDVKVRRGVTLRGKVVGPDGKKVANAILLAPGELIRHDNSVRFLPPPGMNPALWVGVKDGRFELPGCDPAKTYRLVILNAKSGNIGGDWLLPVRAGNAMRFGGPMSLQSPLFRDGKDRLGAVAEVTPPKDPKKAVTIKLARCGSAEVRFVDGKGKPVPVQSVLEIEIAPKQGLGKAALDAETASVAIFWPRGTPPTPDDRGRLTIPALVPGATYHLKNMLVQTDAGKRFKAEAGKTVQLGDFTATKTP
jgi:RNA polymerase sigma factor (sigma-70 family)